VTDLSTGTLSRMVQTVEPGWRLAEATPVDAGFSSVYRVRVETGTGAGTRTDDGEGTGEREFYLKIGLGGEGDGIPADARISALLAERTEIPIPDVLGVVDEHDDLPAPFHLTAPLAGEELVYEAVGWAEDAFLERLAYGVGRNLGRLHRVDAVNTFGYVDRAGPVLRGGKPEGTPAELAVVRGDDDWPTYLSRRFEAGLDELAGSRFSGLADPLGAWLEEEVDRLEGPFTPALCRNDHGLHNLLLDRSGAVQGLPDWAYTLATPPALDVEFAVYIYGGSYLSGLPRVRDRRGLVRGALFDGYRESAPGIAPSVEPERCYAMLARLRLLNHFEGLRLPPGGKERAAARLRAEVESALGAE
jgi:hypothetical protein